MVDLIDYGLKTFLIIISNTLLNNKVKMSLKVEKVRQYLENFSYRRLKMLKIHINVPEIYLLKQYYFWDKFQRFEKKSKVK